MRFPGPRVNNNQQNNMAVVSMMSTVDSKLQPDIPIKPMHLLQYVAHGQHLTLGVKRFETVKQRQAH